MTTRALTRRMVLCASAGVGAVLAIGCGMRSDVIVYLVMFVACLVTFLPEIGRAHV